HVISVNPSDPNMLFAGGAHNPFWRCANCSSAPQWTNLTPNIAMHNDFQAIAWVGNRLILGNDGGVWSTTDLGAKWQNHNPSIPTALFYSGALHPTDPNFMLGGLRDFPVSIRRGGSSAWIAPTSATDWGEAEVAMSSHHPDTDWMGGSVNGVIF